MTKTAKTDGDNDIKVAETASPSAKAKRFGWLRRRSVYGTASIAIILAILAVVPVTRYGLAGLVVKHNISVTVVDSQTGKPVTNVTVSVGDAFATTNNEGKVQLAKQPVGFRVLAVRKAYYGDFSQKVTIGIFGSRQSFTAKLKATGRLVEVSVTNKLSGKPIANAVLSAGAASAKTDAAGHATVVLPTQPAKQQLRVTRNGFNDTVGDVTLGTTGQFALVPSGKLYYLDKRTGVIDVMKSGLDGSNPQVVLKGTGHESDTGTVLLASRDWKYLALLSQRDNTPAKLYLIATATDALSLIDEGNITFNLAGWANDAFIYTVNRTKAVAGLYDQTALKSFDAASQHITLIDQTDAQQLDLQKYIANTMSRPYLIGGDIVYTKFWGQFGYQSSLSSLAGKQQLFVKAVANGTKQTLKSLDATQYQYTNGQLYKPDEIYYQIGGVDTPGVTKPNAYYEYDNGSLNATTAVSDTTFSDNFYPTYLFSPSGKQTLWYEPRDGKNTLFRGDANGGGAKELDSLTSYQPYGWYTDDYILLSKDGSELYIAPSDYSQKPVKITDYHKPQVNFNGYGGGYGGN